MTYWYWDIIGLVYFVCMAISCSGKRYFMKCDQNQKEIPLSSNPRDASLKGMSFQMPSDVLEKRDFQFSLARFCPSWATLWTEWGRYIEAFQCIRVTIGLQHFNKLGYHRIAILQYIANYLFLQRTLTVKGSCCHARKKVSFGWLVW